MERPSAAAVCMNTSVVSAEQLLKRLEWTVLRRLDGLLQGDYRTLLRGTGMDLADLREYQFHDDVRHIDWNVTARLQQPHVRVFTEDREMTAWFLVDMSPSMDFGSQAHRKRDMAVQFVSVLARLLTGRGNRVGALLFGAGNSSVQHTVLPARGGRQQVLQLMHAMQLMDRQRAPRTQAHSLGTPAQAAAKAAGKTAGKVPEQSPTRLRELLLSAGNVVRRRSTIFVVSDFITEAGWEPALGQLVHRHEVTAVRLLDPLELALPDLGMVAMRDLETGEQLMVDTHDKGFRQRFSRIAAAREAALHQGLGRAGADTLELSTDDDLVNALMRFTDLRKRRSRTHTADGGKTTFFAGPGTMASAAAL